MHAEYLLTAAVVSAPQAVDECFPVSLHAGKGVLLEPEDLWSASIPSIMVALD